jgi:hypothetical protein
MNTYDPLSHTVYMHPAAGTGFPLVPPGQHPGVHRLPAGYANRSSTTTLPARDVGPANSAGGAVLGREQGWWTAAGPR